MIDDSIGNASAAHPAGASQGADLPALELRPDMRADPLTASAAPGPDMPRDIAREPPRDIARDATRPPIRDIARDAPAKDVGSKDVSAKDATPKDISAKDGAKDAASRERLRDPMREQQREQLHDLLREMTVPREPPRQPPPPDKPLAADKPIAPPLQAVVATPARPPRSPGLTLLAVLILVLGVIGGGLMAWQLSLLQDQMNDVRAAVAQNAKIADAANRLSDTATQANEMANQSMIGATRPWVGVDAVEAGGIQAGQPLNIEVRVRNSGRTPSTDVQGKFLVYISPIDNPPALLGDQCASCVKSVVLPNGVVSYKLSVRGNVLTADEVQRIKDGKDTMWIVGRLDYHDGEGEAHTTQSCLYYRNAGIATFTACSDGNSAN